MKHDKRQIQKHNNVNGLPELNLPEADPNPDPVARQRAFAIESMKRRQRADSFFHSLNEKQQDLFIQWIDQTEDLGIVYQRLSAPPPEGFGLEVHLTSLRRFRARWRALQSINYNQEMLDVVHDMETEADLEQSARIQSVISHVLHEKAFDLVQKHPGHEALTRVLINIEKLSALEYKRQKLVLEREKLKTNRYHRVDLNIVPPQPRDRSMKTVTAEPPSHLPAPERGCVGDQPQHIRPAEPLPLQNMANSV